MKFIEIAGNSSLPVSNEELSIIEFIRGYSTCFKSMLDARQQEIAKNLVIRGVLTRVKVDGKLCYIINDSTDLLEI